MRDILFRTKLPKLKVYASKYNIHAVFKNLQLSLNACSRLQTEHEVYPLKHWELKIAIAK